MRPINTSLHEAWLSQLVREYENICYQYQVALRLPRLTIGQSSKQLGSWSAKDRLLTLSQLLISTHPWNITLQVLKHEMSHQICSEIYGRHQSDHGPHFQEACRRIGLDAAFHRASADLAGECLADASRDTATEEGRRLIEKIRKLLALSASDNEHEAALALQRAGEIARRHRLSFQGLGEEQGFRHCRIETGRKQLPTWLKMICCLLEDFFNVRVVCSSLYQPLVNCDHKTIELLGRAEEVAIAEHCLHFLKNRLEVLWEHHRRRFTGQGSTARNSYFIGLLAGFRERLERDQVQAAAPEARQPVSTQTKALALHEDQALNDFVAFHFPRLHRRKGRSVRLNQGAYDQAKAEGRALHLRRPVAGQSADSAPLLIGRANKK